MRQIILILFFTVVNPISAQNIYTQHFGDSKNPPVIFIHGGPSGNSNLFEATTAQKLAEKGFYVIVYDRRGEGRSKDVNATMTFNESFEDLQEVYKIYSIDKANLLAHSFGGIVATLFANKFPEKVKSLILVDGLFSQQKTYDHILREAKKQFKNDSLKINQIISTKKLRKDSALYRKQCFEIADKLHFFNMPSPTIESEKLRSDYAETYIYKTSYRNLESPIKFYKNEMKNNLNTIPILKNIIKIGIPTKAFYGKNDGIFSDKQLSTLKMVVGKDNFEIIDNCSHYSFVDQQLAFLNFANQFLSK